MRYVLMGLMALTALAAGKAGALSLEEAREAALAASRSLAQYGLDLRGASAEEKIQSYGMLPSLSLGASASVNLWEAPSGAGRGIEESLSAGAALSLSQKIFDGGKTSLQKALGSISSEITRKAALAEYFSVLSQAEAAYYACLEAEAALELAESSLETALLGLSLAEVRRDNRIIGPGDFLQAQAEKESRENARNQARRDLSLCRAKLRDLTGLPDLGDLEPVDFGPWEELFGGLARAGDSGLEALFRQLWEEVSPRNPGLSQAGLKSRQAELSLDLAGRDYLPSLSASLSTGLGWSYGGEPELQAGRFSLSASIPLDFWLTAARVEKSRAARDGAVLSYQSGEASLALELGGALMDLVSQAGTILSSRRAADYAQANFDYVLELYRLSQSSPPALQDAETLVRNNRSQLIRSLYGFLRSFSKLRGLGAFEAEEDLRLLLGGLGALGTRD